MLPQRFVRFAGIQAIVQQVQSASTIIDLGDIKWTLTSRNLQNISVPGQIPSQAHLDLLSAGVIDEPTYGTNDQQYEWIATGNFTYTSEPIKYLTDSPSTRTLLDFKGIDTFSEIFVCNETVGKTDNQFRRWTFDITKALQGCSQPTIKVELTDAVSEAEVQKVHSNCTLCVGAHFEFNNRQFIRKEQSDFGWDWGPGMAPSGIWQPAQIVQLSTGNNNIFVNSSLFDIYRKGQSNNVPPDQSQPWIMNASIAFVGALSPDAGMRVTINDMDNRTFFQGALSNVTQRYGAITGQVQIDKKPLLWWPIGYGNQSLYNITVDVVDGKNASITSITKRSGFRTIVLNQLPYNETEVASGIYPGTKWTFEVNGQEFYAKGSNMIPPDPFWPRVTKEHMSRIFKAAIASNQNMLRIWASGIYFPDFAYDLADEYGLLLWSELQFGVGFYQTDPAFTESVVQEAKYNVQRVNHHPSLALWCGNNEIQLALYIAQTFPGSIQRFLKQLFEQLFLDSLAHAVFENTRSISYSASSETHGYVKLNTSARIPIVERYGVPYNQYVVNGTLHSNSDYYNYDVTQTFNLSSYPVSRFSVEFGFHSHSPYETYQKSVDAKELFFNSSTMISRNRRWPSGLEYITKPFPDDTTNLSLPGLGEMSQGATYFFPNPSGSNKTSLFKPQIFGTQLFQSSFVRSQIEFYRRGSGLAQRNMGSLYWQLNEIWSSPTWASLAVDGRWKPLHYTVSQSYKPVIIAPYVNDTRYLSVWATSDRLKLVNGTASMKWYDWQGQPINAEDAASWTWTKHVTIGAINSTRLFEQPMSALPSSLSNAVAILTITASDCDGKSNFTSRREFHPELLSSQKSLAAIQDPKLSVRYNKEHRTFTVTSAAMAGFVFLQHPTSVGGWWSENAFWMLPGEKTVEFVFDGTTNETDPGEWAHEVEVTSVFDLTKNY